MKIDVVGLEGEKLRSVDLPKQFSEEYRVDLIKRAVLVIMNNMRQRYGAMQRAGKDYSAKLSRRRHDYKGAYGHGISRVPRKTLWRRGMQFGWVGALAPGTVGGRRAHPPKAEKNWEQKINVKERKKAIRSALSGLVVEDKIKVIDSRIEDIKKTKELKDILSKIGLGLEERKKIRSGKGKGRGRRYKKEKGILFVVSKKCDLVNICDVVNVKDLNVFVLTKGNEPRQSVWSEDALKKLNGGLFY